MGRSLARGDLRILQLEIDDHKGVSAVDISRKKQLRHHKSVVPTNYQLRKPRLSAAIKSKKEAFG